MKKSFKLILIASIMLSVSFMVRFYEKENHVDEIILIKHEDNKDEINTKEDLKKGLIKVEEVIDGDTIVVYIEGERELIRLIGVNAPESPDNTYRKKECFGKEASDFAKNKLNGQKIYLESDDTQGNEDRYNRLLRYVFIEDGTNFNELIIKEGYAHEYTYNLPYKYQKLFKDAEKQAKEDEKGLWDEKKCDN